mmetsp:Transcript_103405/g.175022  ORF Transcript_103405/g.175022 Transcript_103405/m.175022 type:complete len:335 (-) Transcript_103405:715-1719(-)
MPLSVYFFSFFIQAKMASFIRLKQQNSDQLMASLFQATVLAESAREEETRAACTIQAAARMVQHRWDYLLTKVAVIKIQKIYRGYCCRLLTLDKRIEREKQRQQMFYTHFAILIQKTWRGFFSRKWKSNFYEMKAYLAEVVARSNEVRNISEEYRQEVSKEEEKRQREALIQKFDTVTKSLHHLVSTSTIPGVFRNPFSGEAQPTMFGNNIEEVLRSHKAPRRKLPPPSAKKQFLRSTIQSASSYDVVKETELMESKLEKMTRVSKQDFFVPQADTYKQFLPGNRLDKYQGPVVLRETDKRKNISAQPFRRAVRAAEMFDDQGLPPIASSIRAA